MTFRPYNHQEVANASIPKSSESSNRSKYPTPTNRSKYEMYAPAQIWHSNPSSPFGYSVNVCHRERTTKSQINNLMLNF